MSSTIHASTRFNSYATVFRKLERDIHLPSGQKCLGNLGFMNGNGSVLNAFDRNTCRNRPNIFIYVSTTKLIILCDYHNRGDKFNLTTTANSVDIFFFLLPYLR